MKKTMTILLLLLGGITMSNIIFVTPFKNTLEDAVTDCDTVFNYLDSTEKRYEVTYIEEWDNGYIIKAVDEDSSWVTIYYYDAVGDIRLDIIKE